MFFRKFPLPIACILPSIAFPANLGWGTALDFSAFPDKISLRWIAVGNGATAARLTLDQVIGVRIPVPQPFENIIL